MAALSADRNGLGAAIGAPLANAALLAVAFWHQGHDDARTVIFLGYCLFAAFAAPASLSLPRIAQAARTFSQEADAGIASPLAFFLAQLLAQLPLLTLRAFVVVGITFSAANFRKTPAAFFIAAAAALLAAFNAAALALAAVFFYLAKAQPHRFNLSGPAAARRRAMVVARANDLTSLVVLVALAFAGAFRFVSDLDSPWKQASQADFLRWLLQAMTVPQLRQKSHPSRYHDDDKQTALQFIGYQDHSALDALKRGALYGPATFLIIALIALVRMRHVDRE